MKELKDAQLTPEVEKAIREVAEEDIEKVVAEEGEIEKSAPKVFGLSLANIIGLPALWKRKKGG